MRYELWWVSSDGQQAMCTMYPQRVYTTAHGAWDAVPYAMQGLINEQEASDPGGIEDPHAVARIRAGRWDVVKKY